MRRKRGEMLRLAEVVGDNVDDRGVFVKLVGLVGCELERGGWAPVEERGGGKGVVRGSNSG